MNDPIDPIDDLIRDQMRDSFPLGQGTPAATSTLDALGPQMTRARSRHRARQTSVALVGASVLIVGLFTIVPKFGESDSELNLAGPTTSTLDTDALGRSLEDPSSTGVEPTTTAAPTPTSTPTTTAGPTTTAAPTATAPPTTTLEPTTTDAPTTTTEPDANVITTSCGTLEIELVGSGIALVSTNPNSGFAVDVKEDGPSKIEVSFESEGLHCEVRAENRDGQLWSEVDNDSE